MMIALAEFLKARGVTTAAMVHVDELFGLEQAAAWKALSRRRAFASSRRELPDRREGPAAGAARHQAKNPDAFIALSYPPDTFLITGQSKALAFNPKAFYAAWRGLPVYRDKMGVGTVEA